MLSEYYRFRGWTERGVPTTRKLEALGLDELAGAVLADGTSTDSGPGEDN
jgi:hypothetical protein